MCFVQFVRASGRNRYPAGAIVDHLHFSKALLAAGWRSNVLITLHGRTIAAIDSEVPAPATSKRIGGLAVPGLGPFHSHAFQRAVAGLTERPGPEDDSFWTWREMMYAFLAKMTPDDIESIAAMAYV